MGVASGKSHSAERRAGRLSEPAACERCGAVLQKRTWRRRGRLAAATLDAARWVVCPACRQQEEETYLGRVLVQLGPDDDVATIRARVRNVAARAARTQPERRVVSIERRGDELEILTTSQKLAHRVAKELVKAFGGRASYGWSDDGSLLARVK
jgi:NMD protein affecting ribosome stability and mRNA decay